MEHPVHKRVSARLADAAANAVEHGKEMLSDMLTAESRSLADEDYGDVAGRAAAHTQPMVVTEHEDALEGLRATAKQRTTAHAERETAREESEGIINAAWLAEGYPSPVTVGLHASA